MAEPEVEIIAEWPAGQPEDVQISAFVFSHLASAEIDIDVILRACGKAKAWIKAGGTPEEIGKRKARLAEVPK